MVNHDRAIYGTFELIDLSEVLLSRELGSGNRRFMTKCVTVFNHVLGGKRHVLELLSKLKARAKDEKRIERLEGALKYVREHFKEDEEPLY